MTTTEADSLHLSLKRALSANRLVSWTIGEIGSQMKAAKNYLKLHDSPSWKSYCAGLGIPYSTFANYTRLYGVYGPSGLDIGMNRFTAIGPRKLLDIITVINDAPETEIPYWLDDAETLSESDLRIVINDKLGRENKIKRHAETSNGDAPPIPYSLTQYRKLVKSSPCCVCGAVAGEYVQIHSHHFPQTRNLTDADWKVIPLCSGCHRECHDDPKEFLWKYKNNIFGWFYSLAVK